LRLYPWYCYLTPRYSHVLRRTIESKEPVSFFNPTGSKAVVCAFAHTPSLILTGHESGKVALFDVKTGEEILSNERAHMDVITDLQLSPDRTYFITSSRDKTARVSGLVKILVKRRHGRLTLWMDAVT
jgi:translation initiation factor 3 subunit I